MLLFGIWEGRNGARSRESNELACRLAAAVTPACSRSARRQARDRAVARRADRAHGRLGRPRRSRHRDDVDAEACRNRSTSSWPRSPRGGAERRRRARIDGEARARRRGALRSTPTAPPGAELPDTISRAGRAALRPRRRRRGGASPRDRRPSARFVRLLGERARAGGVSLAALPGAGRRLGALAFAAGLQLPYLATARHHAESRSGLGAIEAEFFAGRGVVPREPRALLFTDTFSEVNGVAGTMRRLAGAAAEGTLRRSGRRRIARATRGRARSRCRPTGRCRCRRTSRSTCASRCRPTCSRASRRAPRRHPRRHARARRLLRARRRPAARRPGRRLVPHRARAVRAAPDQATSSSPKRSRSTSTGSTAGARPCSRHARGRGRARARAGSRTSACGGEASTPDCSRPSGAMKGCARGCSTRTAACSFSPSGGCRRRSGSACCSSAFARVSRERPEARLVVVGDGPARRELERTAPGGTVFRRRGPRRGARGALCERRRLLLPEHDRHVRPGHPRGRRVRPAGRRRRGGGALELVADGRSGLLVPPDEPGALAAALLELAESPARRAALGAAGLAAARGRTWGGAIGQLATVYRRVLGLETEFGARRRLIPAYYARSPRCSFPAGAPPSSCTSPASRRTGGASSRRASPPRAARSRNIAAGCAPNCAGAAARRSAGTRWALRSPSLAAAELPELVERLVLVAPAGLPLQKPIGASLGDFVRQVGAGRIRAARRRAPCSRPWRCAAGGARARGRGAPSRPSP